MWANDTFATIRFDMVRILNSSDRWQGCVAYIYVEAEEPP